jgi:uncharacterized sulfatase
MKAAFRDQERKTNTHPRARGGVTLKMHSSNTAARKPRAGILDFAPLFVFILVGLAIGQTALAATRPAKAERPNILVAISDDHSFPHAGAYGDRAVSTPAFDRVAREGVLFTNAFCASPGCSPSRAALLTGRHCWQLEHAGTHASSFPDNYLVYPDVLEQGGYHVGHTGKGWGPGNFRDSGRTRNPAGPKYQGHTTDAPPGISNVDYTANFKDFLKARPEGSPFCFWFGAHEPHRKYQEGAGLAAGKNRDDVDVPAFLPDVPEVQSDMLDYYVEIEWFDSHLARMIALLEQRGELDNTLILVTGDNGMPFPRAKANCYEFGIHVPLAVRWPKRIPADRVVEDLVGFVDFAPTFLEAAGVAPTRAMTGRSLLDILASDKSGRVDRDRQFVLSARERHSSSRYNNLAYPIRAMRTYDYLYIRNFRPDRWPAGHPAGFRNAPFGYYDIDGCPTKTLLVKNRDADPFQRFFHLAVDKRPAEELYDVRRDPANLRNLADDPKHKAVCAQLREELESALRSTGDPRALDGGDIFETYKRYSHMRHFPPPQDIPPAK